MWPSSEYLKKNQLCKCVIRYPVGLQCVFVWLIEEKRGNNTLKSFWAPVEEEEKREVELNWLALECK